jgi:hypothetical protein
MNLETAQIAAKCSTGHRSEVSRHEVEPVHKVRGVAEIRSRGATTRAEHPRKRVGPATQIQMRPRRTRVSTFVFL